MSIRHQVGNLKQNHALSKAGWAGLLSNMKSQDGYAIDIYRMTQIGKGGRSLAITNIPDFHERKNQKNDGAQAVLDDYFQDNVFNLDSVSMLGKLQWQTRMVYVPTITFADKQDNLYNLLGRLDSSSTKDSVYHTYIPQKNGGIILREITLMEMKSFSAIDRNGSPMVKEGDLVVKTFPESPGAILEVQETTIEWQSIDNIINNASIDDNKKSGFRALNNYMRNPSAETLFSYLQLLHISQEDSNRIFTQFAGDQDITITHENKAYPFAYQDGKWVPQFIIIDEGVSPHPVRIQDGSIQVMFASKIDRDIKISHRDDLSLVDGFNPDVDGFNPDHSLGINSGKEMVYESSKSPYVLYVAAFKEVLSSIQRLYDTKPPLPQGIEDQVVAIWNSIIEPHIQKPDFADDGDLVLSLVETIEAYAQSCPPLKSTLSGLANSNSMEAAIKKATEVPPIYNTLVMATLAIVATAIAYFFFPAFVPIVSAISIAAVLVIEIGSSLRAHDPISSGYSAVPSHDLALKVTESTAASRSNCTRRGFGLGRTRCPEA